MKKHCLPQGITLESGERIDTLSGNYIIFQPEHGQRYTTDDMLTAWLAVKTIRQQVEKKKTFFDLGSGLCSVPMIVLENIPDITGQGVEINPSKIKLAQKSLKTNNCYDRFNLTEGDLRDLNIAKNYPFITSTPPYYDKSEGPVSSNFHKKTSRFELHGAITDYFKAAAQHISDDGYFFTVYPYLYRDRVYKAAQTNGFARAYEVVVIPKEGKPPLISLFAYKFTTETTVTEKTIIIRNLDNSFTDSYNAIRKEVHFKTKSK